MIRYLYQSELSAYPKLAETMFRDRAAQFRDRLGWPVQVGADGAERDSYDDAGPLYVIWETPDGAHGGSMRFLPTVGDTMASDHFLHLTDGVRIESPFIWECTRFCLAPGAGRHTAARLMLAGLELGLRQDLSHAVGVFDAPMVRVYRALGWAPEVLGTHGAGRSAISVGLWAFDAKRRAPLAARAQLSLELPAYWYQRAFGAGAKRHSAAA